MKQTFSLLILLILSLGAQAQTLRESVRGKYGEYQGSAQLIPMERTVADQETNWRGRL